MSLDRNIPTTLNGISLTVRVKSVKERLAVYIDGHHHETATTPGDIVVDIPPGIHLLALCASNKYGDANLVMELILDGESLGECDIVPNPHVGLFFFANILLSNLVAQTVRVSSEG